jgi:hydroxymethylglutaryl-CoA lyase
MIRIVEVGPRDGLQNESVIIPTAAKVAFVDALSVTGVTEIEASAFVSPLWVPQLADAEQVLAAIRRGPGVAYSALVPNEKGLDRALRSHVDRIAVFTAASETFNWKNINATIDESFQRFAPVMKRTREADLPVRGYVSTSFWCPYEGSIAPEKTAEVVDRLFEIGSEEVSIGDTTGKAVPREVHALLDLLLVRFPVKRLAMHFHDTYGHAIENVRASFERGIETYDASAGGIGGCPYAPGATGNIATGALVDALRAAGAEVNVDRERLRAAHAIIGGALARARVGRA